MTDGKDLTGFNETSGTPTSPWPTISYLEEPDSAFPSADKSSQDGAGLGSSGK